MTGSAGQTGEMARKEQKFTQMTAEHQAAIYMIGIGPGSIQMMTPQAQEAIRQADVVVGYTVYVDLVKDLCKGKEVLSTGMRREEERCNLALEQARAGKCVAFVCSGDAGVYGMAGIMLEIAKNDPEITIEVIPGITAASSGAAVLGAPLIHDFAVISLSDLLTPWELIEKRLWLAAEADFVIVLYNPRSHKRKEHLARAVQIMGEHKAFDTPCGYVKNIGRPEEAGYLTTLGELAGNEEIDMFTTVFIGNSQTKFLNGKLVTPRGYRSEK